MDSEFQVQIDVLKKRFLEVETTYQKDKKEGKASDLLKTLTSDIFVILRYLFDQAMYSFFKQEVAPKIQPQDLEEMEKRVFFPIANTPNRVRSIFGQMRIKSPEKAYPLLYKFLESIQPYNTGYEWLGDVFKIARKFHRKPTPQERVSESKTELGNGIIKIEGDPTVKIINSTIKGVKVSDLTIDTSITAYDIDPVLNPIKLVEGTFIFEGTQIEVLSLCKKAIYDSEDLLKQFFKSF